MKKSVMIWMRHVDSGKYLTTVGLVTSLDLGTSIIAGYASEHAARIALASVLKTLGFCWDDFEAVTCGG